MLRRVFRGQGKATAQLGPFGLRMGMSVDDLRACAGVSTLGPHEYQVSQLPLGEPGFAQYRLLITPEHGLCRIVATTCQVPVDSTGRHLRQRFEHLCRRLSPLYGPARIYDHGPAHHPADGVNAGWMLELLALERTLGAFWSGHVRSWPGEVEAVALQAQATGLRTGVLELIFELRNCHHALDWVHARHSEWAPASMASPSS